MSPCESLLLSTAPYYREARVTFAWRQTACEMRHCCARRIDETGGRQKLGCTSTRLAERQRMIGAEANRIAMLNAASPRAGSAIGKHCSSSSCSLAMKAFLLGFQRGYSLSQKRIPPLEPPEKGLTLQASSSKSCNACRLHFPARGVAALVLLYDLTYSYYSLPLCPSCRSTA